MRADPRGTPAERARAAVGWKPASQIAGRRDVVRCHLCAYARPAAGGWRCGRGSGPGARPLFTTTAYATCALARHRGEPQPETDHD